MPDWATCPSLFLLTSHCTLTQTLCSVWPFCHQRSLWPYGDFLIPLCWLFQLVFASQISAYSLSLKQAIQHSHLLRERERARSGTYSISPLSSPHIWFTSIMLEGFLIVYNILASSNKTLILQNRNILVHCPHGLATHLYGPMDTYPLKGKWKSAGTCFMLYRQEQMDFV